MRYVPLKGSHGILQKPIAVGTPHRKVRNSGRMIYQERMTYFRGKERDKEAK
jgi:hypothetical protein